MDTIEHLGGRWSWWAIFEFEKANFLNYSFKVHSKFLWSLTQRQSVFEVSPFRNLVWMIWFYQAPGGTWTRDCAMESENLPLNQSASSGSPRVKKNNLYLSSRLKDVIVRLEVRVNIIVFHDFTLKFFDPPLRGQLNPHSLWIGQHT